MDTTQCPQEVTVKPLATNTNTSEKKPSEKKPSEKKPRREKPQPINCPRCNSINTKFCYYNNYSLTQPRYFCKTCRRYWTQGGSIRNIPVGGGTRKSNKAFRSSSNLVSNAIKNLPIPIPVPIPIPSSIVASPQNQKYHQQGQDLNLDFTYASSPSFPALEVLTGIPASNGFHSFMPVQLPGDSNNTNIGLPLQDFKQVPMNFCLDEIGGNGYGNEGNVLFPFEDLKEVSSNNNTPLGLDQNINKEDQPVYTSGFWNDMLGGGGGYHGN